ncbi:hypothetical protein LPB67_15310 [Undibacterium sp. Jales W-56]|uniref:hypothetical protein n=1 Tax=Undibacterium sp. Jales W-56 TaxID=2897325 RepID=UPI0021CF6BB8|nr:hypothetical protein [Undibacterium sp. Jales W-56]MCU6435145.1 hypothetical protein [Undibacterium sp. Jales W-56]
MTKPCVLLFLFLATCLSAQADPGYYVVTVYDNKDEKSLDYRYWTVKSAKGPEIIWPELGFGYGVNSRWYTELYASAIGTSKSDLKLSTWNWQNDYQLTQGQYPFDLALHTNFIRPHDTANGYAFEFGPALQTDIGKLQLNGNVFFEHSFATEESYGDGHSNAAQMKYQWQVKYRWMPALQIGLQGFGELGDWDHWVARDRQSHRVGPAVFGSLALTPSTTFKYQAAYLTGSVYSKHADMFTMRLQLLF